MNKIIAQLIVSLGVGLLISGYISYVVLRALYKVGGHWLGWGK